MPWQPTNCMDLNFLKANERLIAMTFPSQLVKLLLSSCFMSIFYLPLMTHDGNRVITITHFEQWVLVWARRYVSKRVKKLQHWPISFVSTVICASIRWVVKKKSIFTVILIHHFFLQYPVFLDTPFSMKKIPCPKYTSLRSNFVQLIFQPKGWSLRECLDHIDNASFNIEGCELCGAL